MNLYAVAMTAKRFDVLEIESRMLYGDDIDAVNALALEMCRERFRSGHGYYDHKVALTGYDLLGVLNQLKTDIANARTKERRLDDGLTLATLCDMVLGEDSQDRSNYTLIRAIGKLVRACPELDKGE